ncbi:MAG: hypothetical protein WBX14_11695 [Candidatus Udaeobacter sp.]
MKFFSYFTTSLAIAAIAVALGLISLSAYAAPVTPSAPAEDILDIRPPIHIAAPFPWLAWSVGALWLIGVSAVAWKLRRRQKRKLAYEIALERLENTRPLMRESDAEPFSLAVSEIVRRFIEEMLPVPAAHRTTDEFLRNLTSLSYLPLAQHRDSLANFLCHCDLAKFARWSLTVWQMEVMLESAKAFVVDLGQSEPAKAQAPTEADINLAASHNYSPTL